VSDLLLTAITKPLFLEEEFTAEFGNVREELTARSNNHFRHLSLALREAYGFKVLTDQTRLQLMENVVLKDIREHYAATHTAKNLRFVIAGKLPKERQKILAGLIENIELPAGDSRTPLPLEKPHSLNQPLFIANESVKNLYFYIDTFLDRRMTDPETDSLSLINTMLTETLYSRILGSAREHGLVYSMSSGFGQSQDSSNWWFGAQIMPKNAHRLFDIIVRELEYVFKGEIDEQDVKNAKQYALGRYQRSGQTVSGTAAGYSGRYFFDDVIDDYYKIPERIAAVDKEQIITISKAMFRDGIWGLGALGNSGEEFVEELYYRVMPLWLSRWS
jgi:predicted Zn-dependent peptidase